MNNLQKIFKNQKLIIPYLLAGYPDIQTSKKAMELALELCPVIELGLAFSDPIADGPTLQMAHSEALSKGANPILTLEIASELKSKYPQSAIILMTYLNPVHRIGYSNFLKRAFGAKVDALLIPDLPAEESQELLKACKENSISLVLLASPSTSKERLKKICELSEPFVYLVSIYGTTGTKEPNIKELEEVLKNFKEICKKPIALGFGINNPSQAKELLKLTQGIVIGTALAKSLKESLDSYKNLLRSFFAIALENSNP